MANKITQVIDVDTKGGVKNVGKLTTELEGAESAGKQAAKALQQMADHIETDMKETATAADALGAALGPELAARIGQNGLVDMVSDLKKLGLTSQDIEADVDDLAMAIKKLDTVGAGLTGPTKGLREVGDSADKARGQVRHLGDESDNSRSVMANMAGNSAQDIAAIGGASSTAGMALGQMAEYASEGNISLKGLGKVVGPMAAITVATMALAQGSKQAAQRAKELEEAYQDLTSATDDQAMAVVSKMMIDAALSGRDLKDMFLEMADANIVGAKRLLDLMHAQGLTTEQTKLLSGAIAEHDAAVERAAKNEKLYGDATEDLGISQKATEGATKALATGTDVLAKAMAGAESDISDTKYELDRFAESIAGVDQAYSGLTGKLDEQDAWENVVRAIGEAGNAAKLTGQDARDLTRDIADYVAHTNTIPVSKKTEILALLDEGQLVAAEQALADLTRTRNIYLALTGPGAVTAAGYGPLNGAKAHGGPVSPGGAYLVGEEGPEVLQMGSQGGNVIPNNKLGGSSGPINVTIQMPVGSNGDDVVRAIKKFEARNGPGWRS